MTLRSFVLICFLITRKEDTIKISGIFFWAGVEKCGATDNRIVGGRPAEEGEFPYQVI